MNLVVLNALNTTKYAEKELYLGKSSLDFAIDAACKLPGITKKVVFLPHESSLKNKYKDFEVILSNDSRLSSFIKEIIEISKGFKNIFYFNADCPLIDTLLAEKIYKNHEKYFCEYSFADGYPKGITPEIVKTSILPAIYEIAQKNDGKVERDSLFKLIEKDINAFELETEISPDDQRLLRISLYPDTKRNFLQLKAITEKVFSTSAELDTASSVLKIVRNKGELLRPLPAFFEFETTSGHNQKINYFPVEQESNVKEMNLENFKTALEKISAFSEDAVISLSIRNEPSIHSNLPELAAAVLSYPMFSLLIETSGTAWHENDINQILSMDSSKITWIVDLDALDPDLYKKLRGEGYNEAYSFAKKLIEKSPANTWVQATRMVENEEDNENFYKHWKEITNNIIIQKYDWCCGLLKQRKVTDLSPVKRFPCWHLKRDVAILVDGKVPLCRDDLNKSIILGNIFSDDISTIWSKGQIYYTQHLKEEYSELCERCDEYYTFNY